LCENFCQPPGYEIYGREAKMGTFFLLKLRTFNTVYTNQAATKEVMSSIAVIVRSVMIAVRLSLSTTILMSFFKPGSRWMNRDRRQKKRSRGCDRL